MIFVIFVMAMIEIKIDTRNFLLLSEKAIFWEDKKILIVSDLHLGKTSHFRKHGIAIPNRAAIKDLQKLNELILKYNPESIIFLGDLFHSDYNNEWEIFISFRKHYSAIHFILIKGNHDIINPHLYSENYISVHDSLYVDDILFSHEKSKKKHFRFQFYGHTHPGIKIKSKGKLAIKLPCFAQHKYTLLMPAFGELTGLYLIDKKDFDKIYAIAEGKIYTI
ncbi:MAG: ligase-associated DNA damage response endonuclease PdeM [Bacteroidia bacterium]